jgi:formylglycine-generating enzyme
MRSAFLLLGFLSLPVCAQEPKKLPPLARFPFDEASARKLQDDWASALGVPKEITNSIGMKLVLIPAGTYEMGAHGSKTRVTIGKPFYLGSTEVTLGQYRKFKAGHRVEGAADEFNADDRPAAMISWKEAGEFCEWLSKQKDESGKHYALPTSAQWEWAARAGSALSRHYGDSDKEQAKYTWFNVTYTQNPKNEEKGRGRQPVGKLLPNAWGLYDMLGNVWEWCSDKTSDAATGESRDPIMRGGSWRSGAFHCTSVAHDPGSANQKGDNIGFRVMCAIEVK